MTPACIGEQIRNVRLALQFVDRGSLDGTPDGNLRARRGDNKRIAALEPFVATAFAVEEEVVQVDIANMLLSAVVLERAERADRSWTTCGIQRIERRRERTDFIRAWPLDIAHNVDSNRAQSGNGHGDLNVAVLSLQRVLNCVLCVLQGEARDLDISRLGQSDMSVERYYAREGLRDSAPHIDREAVAWPYHVIRADGNVERHRL